ncbi:cytochrome c oxidase subunit II [Amnibacterium flavum]|uniref:cytochrome-c oxidase n=1 Tax=Amnibacterium flavum TaxID=2173173 RepID=A0A2V1HPV4_9MICO|nr:cytochrome c oxidase subunit II [Amnibacterium flavum]PVZ94663.1 cytochrome c oxidase subunit II [Amnibacterium flavum]
MRTRRRLRWAAVPLAATVAVVLAGCTQAQLHGFLPGFQEDQEPVTNHTQRVSDLWVGSWVVLLAVGVITWGLILAAAIVYRRRRGQTGLPVQLRYNMPIEIFYTVVPLILVLGFFAFTARDQAAIEARDPNPDVTIEAYGKQWAWDFNYLDEDVYTQGVQGEEEARDRSGDGVDYDKLPVLVLPVNKSIEIQLKSRDVIHSFWVIDFLYKKDMIPGKTNYMTVTPTREGTYQGKCAELCGDYHAQMLFTVKVVSEDEYEAYIESLRDQGFEGRVGDEFNRNLNEPGNTAPDGSDAPASLVE